MTVQAADRKHPGAGRGMYRRIARNSAFLAGGTAASSLFMMLSVAIAARALSARDFGALVLLQSAVLMLSSLSSFSTQQPVIKLGSDAQAEDNRRRLGEVISMGLVMDVIASVLALLVAAIIIAFVPKVIGLSHRDTGSAWIMAVSLLFTGYLTSNGIFRLYDRFGLLSIVQTLSAAGLLVAYGALFAIHAELRAFVWTWAIYLALSSISQLCISLELVRRDHVPLSLRPRLFSTEDGRTLLHYCWSTWGTSTAQTIRTNGDSLLVGAMISVEAAGVYNVARQLAGVLRKFNVVYSSTVFPEIARLGARNDLKGARKLNRRMLWAGLAAAVVGVAMAIVFGHVVLRVLFGARFETAYVPFVIMTAAAIAQLISTTPSMCVQVYRGPRHLLFLYVTATIIFAVAAVALTFKLEITGMALAQLIFAVALTLLCNFALRRAKAHAADPDQVEASGGKGIRPV